MLIVFFFKIKSKADVFSECASKQRHLLTKVPEMARMHQFLDQKSTHFGDFWIHISPEWCLKLPESVISKLSDTIVYVI